MNMVRGIKVKITSYDLTYLFMKNGEKCSPESPEKTVTTGLLVRLKCYSEEEKKSYKFYLPLGEKRLQAFMLLLKAKSTDEFPDKEFQILTYGNIIFGISQIGDIEKVSYISCSPSDEKWADAPHNKFLSYSALDSLITEFSRTGKPYYVKIN